MPPPDANALIQPLPSPGREPSGIPVAEYVRMSTDHERYSIANQSAAIRTYAVDHGIDIALTDVDPGRTGLTIRHRPGLSALVSDVVSGRATFKAILVLDISRWGRFQDTEESAHYEFLCRSAGISLVTSGAVLKPGKGKTHRAYLWSYCTTTYNETKAVVFDFADSRAGQHARDFLGISGEDGWKGSLVCDDFSGNVAAKDMWRPLVLRRTRHSCIWPRART